MGSGDLSRPLSVVSIASMRKVLTCVRNDGFDEI